MSVPSAPNIWVRPLATSGQLEFWWQPPANTGNSPVTYYQLQSPQIGLLQNFSSNVFNTRVPNLTNHTEYVFSLAAANASGLGNPSTFTSVQPGNKPKSNYISSFTMTNPSTAMLKWAFSTNTDEGTTKWFVVNAVPSTTANSTVLITTSISSYSTILTNLVQDTYALQVFAVNDSGWQQENTTPLIVDTTYQLSTPTAVTNIAVTNITQKTATVSWTGAIRVAYYTFSLNNGTVIPSSYTAGTNLATFTDLSNNAYYLLNINAVNNVGTTKSENYLFKTLEYPPTKPTNLLMASRTTTSFVIQWTGGANAASYTFLLNNTLTEPTYLDMTQNAATFTNLSVNTTYNVVVTAINSGGPVSSLPGVFTTLPLPPTVPSSLTIQTVNYSSFTVGWEGAQGASSYVYTLNNISTIPYTQSVLDKTALFTNLSSNTVYSTIIFAINEGGNSISNSLGIRTFLPPMTTPSSLQVTNGSISQSSFSASWKSGDVAQSAVFNLNSTVVYPQTYSLSTKTATFINLTTSTNYSLFVQLSNESGSTATSTISLQTLIAPPYEPISIIGTALSPTAFSISWTGGLLVSSYTFTLNSILTVPSAYSLANQTASFTSLTPATGYSVVVIGTNPSGTASSLPTLITTNPAAPLAPTSLASSLINNTGFTVTWSGAAGATSFTFTLNGSATTPTSYSFGSKSATFTNLSSGSAYNVIVIATNATGSTQSQTLSVTTTQAPTQPINITASAVSTTTFTLSWSGGAGATSYTYSLGGTTTTPASQILSPPSAVFTNLTQYTTYDTIVTAVNSSGSTSSAVVAITTASAGTPAQTPLPTTPSNISSSNITSSSFTISWTEGVGATAYLFTVNGSATTPTVYSVDSKTATFTNLTMTSAYTVVIIASNETGTVTSSPVTVNTTTVAPSQPINIIPSGITQTGFTITWLGGDVATSYSFTLNGNAANPASSSVVNKTATFNSLTINTTYAIIVTATNSGGSTASNLIYITLSTGAPTVPSSITVNNISPTAFNIAWLSGDIATSNTFTLNGIATDPVLYNFAGKTANFQNLLPSTTYSVVVIATNPTGSTPSQAQSFNTIYAKPTQPINISFSTITPSSFTALWQQGDVANSNYFYINSTLTTPLSYSVTNKVAYFNNLQQNTTYAFTVTAVNSTDYTTSATYEVSLPITVPSQPSLSSSAIKTNSFTINWTGGDVSLYYVYTLNGMQTTPASQSIASKTATFTNLVSNLSYTVTVTGYNQSGASPTSAPLTVTTLPFIPNQPINLTSYNITSSGFSISWYKGDIATNYSFTLNGTTTIPQTLSYSQKTATFTNLAAFTGYNVIVIPANGDGNSPSAALNVSTIQAGPTRPYNLTTTPINGSLFNLYWSGGNGATSYSFIIDKTTVFPNSLSIVSSSAVLARPTIDPRNISGLRLWLDANDPLNNGGSIPGSVAITPIFVPGCVMWLDGADPLNTGTAPSNGTTINTWYDKSISANNMIAQSTATYTTNALNGLGALNFNSSWYRATSANAPYPVDVYLVVKLNSLTAHADVCALSQGSSDNFNSLTFSEYTTSRWHNGSTGFSRTPGSESSTDETSTGFLLMQWSIANNNFYIYRNGVQIAQTSSYTWSPGTPYFQLGNRFYTGANGLLVGQIAEVVVYNSQLDTTNRQTVEGYLAGKWNIRSSLPINHPYRSSSPTSSPYVVTTWFDRSGNGKNARANTPITYSSTGNAGRSALMFTGSQWLNGNVSITGSGLTILAVVNMSSSSSATARVISLAQQGQDDYNNNSFMGFMRIGNTGITPNRNGTSLSNNPTSYSASYLSETWFDGSNMYATVQDGNSTTINSTGSSGNFNVSSFTVGSSTNIQDPNGYFYGAVSEIIVYDTNISISNRQNLEGYMAWKWGIQSKLPTSHPYYNNGPNSSPYDVEVLATNNSGTTSSIVVSLYPEYICQVSTFVTPTAFSSATYIRDTVFDNTSTFMYITDTTNNSVWQVAYPAGTSNQIFTGIGQPWGITIDNGNNAFIASVQDNAIYALNLSTFSTTAFTSGYYNPYSVTIAQDNYMYVSDSINGLIVRVASDGTKTNIKPNFADASRAYTSLIAGAKMAPDGYIYFCDANNHRIVKMDLTGKAITFAGSTQAFSGLLNGTGTATLFNYPIDLDIDIFGNLYVCDFTNSLIRRVTPNAVVTTLVGSGLAGNVDNTLLSARITPNGVKIGANGNLFLASPNTAHVRQVMMAPALIMMPRSPFKGGTLYPYLPSQPINVVSALSLATSIQIAWYGGDGATSYIFYLNGVLTAPASSQLLMARTTGTIPKTATFTGLTYQTSYTVIVVAVNADGLNASNPTTITTSGPPPTQPTNITVSGQSTSGFTISWSGVTGATSYLFYFNGSLQAAYTYSVANQTATFTGLSAGTTYSVVVDAVNVYGDTKSLAVPISTYYPAPTAITNVNASSITASGFTIGWSGGVGANSYTFTLNGTLVTPASYSMVTNTAIFTGLNSATSYVVVVIATNFNGTTYSALVANPASVTGIQFWLDGQDPLNTGTPPSNGALSTWFDKSGLSNNITQSNGTFQPTFTNNYVTFNNNRNYPMPISVMNNTINHTLFFVFNPTSNSNFFMVKQKDGANTYNALSMTVYVNSGGGGATGTSGFVYWHNKNGALANYTTVFSTGTTYLIALVYDGTTINLYINGTLNNSATGSQYNLPNDTSPTGWILGGWYQSGGYVNSNTTNYNLYSMLFFTTALGTTDRQNMEGYLAWRFGTNSSLPSNHPYYSSGPSAGFLVSTLTGPPSGITATTVTTSSIAISWTGGTGATSYTFTLNGLPVTPSTYSVGSKTATFTGLTVGTSYSIVVSSVIGGNSNSSSPVIIPTLPSQPTSVSSSAITFGGFSLAWSGATGATSYTFTLNGTTVTPQTVSVANQTATFTNLYGPITYSVIVLATNSSGATSSTAINVSLPTPPAPTQPTNIVTSAFTTLGFNISWSGGLYATSYTFTINGTLTSPTTQSVANSTATFANLSVSAGSVVSLIVIATNVTSSTSSATRTIPLLPTQPTTIVRTAADASSFTFGWSGATGATAYAFSLNGITTTPSFSSVTYKTATFTGLAASTTYAVIVTAINASGSTASSSTNISTAFAVPNQATNLIISGLTNQGFTVAWSNGDIATSNTFTLNGVLTNPSSYNLNSKTATFTGLAGSTTYNLVVISTNSTGSSYSQSSYVTTPVGPPGAPTGLTLTAASQTALSILWSGGLRATSFTFTLNGNSVTPSAYSFVNNTATFSSLTAGTTYVIIVTAVNGAGSTASAPLSVPTTPANITSVTNASTSNSLSLSWLGGNGATSYTFTLNSVTTTPASLSIASGVTTVSWAPPSGNQTPLGGQGQTIVWNGTYWLAGGQNAAIVRSSNNYTNRIIYTSHPLSDGLVYNLAWNGTYWVAVGYNSDNTISIALSTSGSANWVQSTNNPFNPDGYGYPIGSDIAWNGSYWIATAYGNPTTCIALSSDGFNWSPPSSSDPFTDTGGLCNAIAWNGSYWLAGGQTGDNVTSIIKSSDGNTWIIANSNPFTNGCMDIAWNGSYWLAVGFQNSITIFAKSTDGLNWTSSSVNSFSSCVKIIWVTTYWAAVGTEIAGSVLFATSSDGLTWVGSSISPLSGGYVSCVDWNGTNFITVGYNSNNSVDMAIGTVSGGSSNSSATFTGLTPGTAYAVVITAINSSGSTSTPSTVTPQIVSGLQIWFDGADPLNTGTAPSTGTSIQTWSDKSGNSYNAAQVTVAKQPTYVSGGGVLFSRPNATELILASSPTLNTGTWFFLISPSSTINAYVYWSSNSGQLLAGYQGNAFAQWNWASGQATNVFLTGLTAPQKNLLDWTITANTNNYGYYNGTSVFSQTGLSSTNNTRIIGLGNSTAPATDYFSGTMYEIIVYNTSLNITDRQLIEGYLAWKWGIQTSLPANHPYYSAAPLSPNYFYTSPTKPTGLAASLITQTSLTLTWSGVIGAQSYTYSFNGSTVTPATQSLSGQTATFTGLTAGTAYSIIVNSVNSGGSTASNPLSVTTTPSTPTGLASNTITSSGFSISWSNGSGATSNTFTINSNPATPTTYDPVAKTASFGGLGAGTTYSVTAVATNSSGSSPASSALSVVTLATQPTTITSNTITTSGFSIAWLGGLGATSYTFTLNGVTTTPSTYSTSAQTATFTGLTSGTAYATIVQAVTAGGSNSSAAVTITTLPSVPTQPTSLTGSAYSPTSFTVSWSGGTYATYYDFKINGTTTIPDTYSVSGKNAVFSGLSPGTSYGVIVTAANSAGTNSSASTNILTTPSAPTNIYQSNGTGTGFQVNWQNGVGATSYSYTFNGSAATPSNDFGVASKYAIFTGLSFNTGYTVVVTAINASGSTSGTASFNPRILPSMSLWLDSNDAATIKTNIPEIVNLWSDKSGNNNNYSTINTTYPGPVYTSTLSGVFFSTNAILTSLNNLTITASTNIYYVAKVPFITGTYQYLFGQAGADMNIRYIGSTLGSGNSQDYTSNYIVNGQASNIVNYTSTHMVDLQVQNGLGTYSTSLSNFNNNRFFKGTIYELIIYQSTLTSTNQQLIEGYLAWKWNTNLGLSVSHPYKTIAPSAAFFTGPTEPISMNATNILGTSFTLSWAGATGATSYTFTVNSAASTPTSINISGKTANFAGFTSQTTYNVVVIAQNIYGTTASNVYTFYTFPSQPLNLAASSVTGTSFTLSWTGGIGASSYTYKLNGVLTTPSVNNGTVNNTAQFTGLTPNTTYVVIVIATNSVGSTPSANPYSPTSVSTCKMWYDAADPLNNGTPPASGTTITTWFDRSGNSNNASGSNQMLNDGYYYINFTNTFYTITTMEYVVNNYFTIFFVDTIQSYGGDNYFLGANSAAGTDSGLHLTYRGGMMIGFYSDDLTYSFSVTTGVTRVWSLTFTSSPNTYTQTIYLNGNQQAQRANNGPLLAVVSPGIGRVFGTTNYTGRIREIIGYQGNLNNADRQSVEGYLTWKWGLQAQLPTNHPYYAAAPSSGYSFTTGPAAPTSLTTSSRTATSITISWSGASGATSYSYTINGNAATPSTGSSSPVTFTGLTINTTYTVVVTAVNSFGSTPSASFSSSTLPNPPTAPASLTVTNASATGFTINWTGGDVATSYTYKINGTTTTPSNDQGVASKYATFTGLTANTTYVVIVTAVNDGGSTSSSGGSSLTTFSPAALANPIYWFDASNSSSIVASGTTITKWLNQGLAGNATGGSANVTTGSTAMNSLNTVRFPSQAYLSMPSYTADSYTASIFVMMRGVGNGTNGYWIMLNNSYGPDMFFYNTYLAVNTTNGEINYSYTSGSVTGGTFLTPTLATAVINSSNTSLPNGGWINGNIMPNTRSGGHTVNAYTTMYLGQYLRSDSNAYDMAEMVFFPRQLGALARQAVEGYLAWKWGTQANLPSGHLYKSARPTATVWAPTSVPGCRLWLDAADPLNSGTAPSNGTNLSTWFDKSGFGYNGAVSGTITLNTNALNSLPAAYFTAQGSYTNSPIPANTFLNAFSFFAVYKSTGNAGNSAYNTLVNRTMNSSGYPFDIYNYHREIPANSNWSGVDTSYNLYNTSNSIYFGSFSPTAGVYNEFSNGTSVGNYSVATFSPTDTGTSVYVGNRFDGALGFVGNMHEVLVFNTYILFSDRQMIEGYLAWKWGLQANLPSNHLYKAAFPISIFSPYSVAGLTTWYDATDPSNNGTVPSNGATVTTWFDKSGNGYNLTQVPSAALPTFATNMINTTMPLLNFTNTSGLYTLYNIPKASSITVLWVGIVKNTGSSWGTLWGHFSGGRHDADVQLRRVANSGQINWHTNNDNTVSNLSYIDNAPIMYSCTMANGQIMYFQQTTTNGTTYVTDYIGLSWAAGTAPVWVGVSDTTEYIQSYIGEVLYYQNSVSITDRQKLEGHLAWKWGLNTYLPASHPYYSTNPSAPAGQSVTTGPGQPTSLAQSNTTQTGFTISWSGAASATSFTHTINGSSATPTSSTSSSATFGGLTVNTTYNVIVTAVNSFGSTPSATFSASTAPNPPTQPTSITTSNVSGSAFTVNWTGGVGATSYTYTLNGTTTAAAIDNGVASKNATFTGLTANTSYTVIIIATNSGGSTASSLPFSPNSVTGINLWLDGFDPLGSGTAPSNGTSITTWSDKSTNNNSLTGSGTYVSSTKGVNLNGTSNYYSFSQMPLTYTGSVAYVVNIKQIGNWDTLFQLGPDSAGITFRMNGYTNNTVQINTVGGQDQIAQLNIYTNQLVIFYFTFTGTASSSTSLFIEEFGNGTLATNSGTASRGITPGNQGAYVGTYASLGGRLTAEVYEIIYYNNVLDATSQQSIEGYLAWKWGLRTSLPSNHPYYNSPPTSGLPVSTLAGSGAAGGANGSGTAASFYVPLGLSVDSTGNVYVCDTGSHLIRKITPAGIVTTIAGQYQVAGDANGTGTGATFNGPQGCVVYNGVLYVCQGNGTIRAVNLSTLVVTTFATGITGGASYIASDGTGNFYASSYGNGFIFKITSSGTVTQFSKPTNSTIGIAVDTNGNVYVSDATNNSIRRVTQAGVITTIATGLSFPCGLCISSDNSTLYITDTVNHVIRQIVLSGPTMTVLTGTVGTFGSTNGTLAQGRFFQPYDVKIDPTDSFLYVADQGNQLIRRIIIKSATAITTGPSQPTGLSSSSVTSSGFTISWSGGTSATSYTYNLNGSNVTPATDNGVSAQNAVFTGRTPATTFTIFVIANNANGSTSSASFTVSTPAEAVPFSASDVNGLQFWVDATDPNGTGTLPNNGTAITSWVDKSGANRNATATGTCTFTTNSQNTKPGIALSQTSFRATIPSGTFTNATVIFAVYKNTANNSANALITRSSPSSNIGIPDIYNTGIVVTNSASPYGYNGYTSPNVYNTSSSVYCVIVNQSANTVAQWTNGISQSIGYQGYGTLTPADIYNSLYIGTRGDGASTFTGLFYEIQVFNIALNSIDRQSIEGSLAWKWGLQGSLPASHPFKSAAPTGQPVYPNFVLGNQVWLDGHDPLGTGISGSNGASLTTWSDKSGNSRSMAFTGSAITYANNTINSLNTILLNGTISGIINAAAGTFPSNYCGFIITRNTSGGSTFFGRTDASAWAMPYDMFGGARYIGIAANNRIYAGDGTNVAGTTGSTFLWNFTILNYATSGNTGTYAEYYNGTQVNVTGGQTTGFNAGDNATTINFGARGGYQHAMNANYCEIVIYNSNLSTTNRQIVEGYLAWKWGIQASLPANHPHYSTMPQITLPSPAVYLFARTYSGSGTWLDRSGNGVNATLESGTATKNAAGNGLVLNGSTNWLFPNIAAGNLWSVSIWYKNTTSTLGIGTSSAILSQIHNGTNPINITVGDYWGSTVNVMFYEPPWRFSTSLQNYFTTNTWVHIIGTWNGTNLNSYINGTLIESKVTGGTSIDGGTAYRIGRRWDSAFYTTGEIGEVRIYKAALTIEQVLTIYNTTKPIYPQTAPLPSTIAGLIVWVDGSDPLNTGTPPSNGTAVSTWYDKSGNSNHMIALVNGTYTSNSQNGLGTVSFSSSVYRSTIKNIPYYPVDAYFVVKVNSLTNAADVCCVCQESADNFNSLTFSEYTSSKWHNGSSGFGRTPNAVASVTETSTSFLIMSWSIATNNFYIYRNGVQIMVTSSYSWSPPASVVFCLGTRVDVNAGNRLVGNIAEAVVYTSQLSTTNRQTVEGYLAGKWGLKSQLPSNHPYYA
jgi:sugar lactone lactonase YvrE